MFKQSGDGRPGHVFLISRAVIPGDHHASAHGDAVEEADDQKGEVPPGADLRKVEGSGIMSMFKQSGDGRAAPLTQGSIVRSIVSFALPMLLGQFLQQLYNMADAWVLGNFADNGTPAHTPPGTPPASPRCTEPPSSRSAPRTW